MANEPRLTTSMDQLKADLEEHGFAMMEGALDVNTTAAIRDRVLEQAPAEKKIGYGNSNRAVEPDDDVNQWVAFPPNKSIRYRSSVNLLII